MVMVGLHVVLDLW